MQNEDSKDPSGCGSQRKRKNLITCGLLEALVDRGLKTASFKCGPDYIDPMFHSRVIGTKSRNLDTFFTSSEITRYLLARNACGCRIAVMEGVMGIMTAWEEPPPEPAPTILPALQIRR